MVAIVLSACGGAGQSATTATAMSTPTTTAPTTDETLDPTPFAWILESGLLEGETVTIVPGHEPTLVFDDGLGTVSGRAACNTYVGPYTLEGTSIRFGDLFQTAAACVNEEIMDSETQFMTAMGSIGSFTMDDMGLSLVGESARLDFVVVDPTAIPWRLVSGIVDGEPLTTLPDHPVTLVFDEGSAGGTAACNGYTAGYELSDGSIRFEQLAATAMACSPPEVMTLESTYLDALLSVDSLITTGTTLTLAGDGVELEFVSQVPVPTSELTGVVWELDTVIDGDTASTPVGDTATLELFTDGSHIGSTGCRTLTGRYAVLGAEVQVPELTAQGECPEEVRDQDSLVVAVIGDGFMVEIAGDSLTVTSGEGQGLIYTAEG